MSNQKNTHIWKPLEVEDPLTTINDIRADLERCHMFFIDCTNTFPHSQEHELYLMAIGDYAIKALDQLNALSQFLATKTYRK